TRAEGAEFCDFDKFPTCDYNPQDPNSTIDFDNIIDPFVPDLGLNVFNRFDRFRDFGQTFNGITFSQGLEFFDGVADSIGTLAWDMTGRDLAPPRILDLQVLPGQIQLQFSEGVDIASLMKAGNISLIRDDGDNGFVPGTTTTVAFKPI